MASTIVIKICNCKIHAKFLQDLAHARKVDPFSCTDLARSCSSCKTVLAGYKLHKFSSGLLGFGSTVTWLTCFHDLNGCFTKELASQYMHFPANPRVGAPF